MVPMLIMSFIVFYHFVNVLKDEVKTNLRSPFIKSIDNLEAQVEQLTRTSLQIELNSFLRTVNINDVPYDAINVKNELLKYHTNSFVDEIFLFNYKDEYIYSCNYLCSLPLFNSFILGGSNTFDLLAFKDLKEQEGFRYFPMDSMYLANRQSHLMYLKKIPVQGTRPYGIIMYMIPESSLRSILAPSITGNSSVFVIDPATREILFHFSDDQNDDMVEVFQQMLYSSSQPGSITEAEIDGNKYSLSSYEPKNVPYVFIQLMPNNLLSNRIKQIRNVFLISMVIIIILSGIVIAILMRINYRPIKNLKKLLEENFQFSSKSIDGDKLNELELLEYALLQYNRENIDLKEYSQANREAVKSYLIDCFLSGQAREIDNILETCRKAGLIFDKNYYCALVIKSSNISNLPDAQVEEAASSIHQPEKFQISLHRDIHMNNIVMLLGSATKDENHTRLIALHLIKTLNDEYGNDVRVGVGNYYESMFDIDASYEEAIKVLDHNRILSKSHITMYSDISKKGEKSMQYPLALFEALETAVRNGDVFNIDENITQLVYFMKNENISILRAKNICYDTVNTISRELLKKYNHSPLLNKPYIERIYGADLNTFVDIEGVMKEISEDITNYLKEDTDTYELKLLQQIVKYIRDNYPDPEFSLQSLADSLQMSTPYLSQYFKKNTDFTISEYVTRLRMEKAKDLLLKTELSVQEIAVQVGYYSVSSFIRKFREKENVTPGQFKKKYA
jgi:AraC-like DNA-binding protein